MTDIDKAREIFRGICEDGGYRSNLMTGVHLAAHRPPFYANYYPHGISNGHCSKVVVEGDDWLKMAEEMQAAVKDKADAVRAQHLRNLALKIVDLTELGECTDVNLRLLSFTDEQIADLSEEACALAQKMADCGPFSVTIVGPGNGEVED